MSAPCNIYLVRHGETDWNKQGLMQGHRDIPLNDEGKEQARALADIFQDVPLDAAFSSDLMRAKHTAEIIAKRKNLVVKTHPLLRERSMGALEGVKFAELKVSHGSNLFKVLDTLHTDPTELSPDLNTVETYAKVVERVLCCLNEISQTHNGKNVLVVSHGAVLKSILMYVDNEKYRKPGIKNAGYIHLELHDGKFVVKKTEGVVSDPVWFH